MARSGGRNTKLSLAYWLKKRIITDNLFGVDIMEEAVEIAKLRLFLALVASAERREQLEPLPNIEFNLLPRQFTDWLAPCRSGEIRRGKRR